MGLRLSQIQEFALELAMLLDDQASVKDQTEQFKRALITADPMFWLNKLYADRIDRSAEPEEEWDISETGVTWVMPDITEDEFIALERELANRKGTLTMEDLKDEEGWQ